MRAYKNIKTGKYHLSNDEECQDAVLFWEDGDFAAAVIADGVSACECGKEGAATACAAAVDFIKREKARVFSYSHDKIAYLITEHILYYLENQKEKDKDVGEYSCVVAIAYTELRTGKTILINLGDCDVLSFCKDKMEYVLKGRRYFGKPVQIITKKANCYVEVKEIKLFFGDVLLLCTDGFSDIIQRDGNKAKEIGEYICRKDFDGLNGFLCEIRTMDDCSYIAVERS